MCVSHDGLVGKTADGSNGHRFVEVGGGITVGVGVGTDVDTGVVVGVGAEVGAESDVLGFTAYMLMAPVVSIPHIIPNGLAKPFEYELTAL